MAIAGVTDYTNTYAANRTSYNAKGSSGLSETAQSYLSDLKQKYLDVNITVTDFKNDKQMDNFILGSGGGNNIAVSSNIIEKMATDSATAAKYEKVIADVPNAAKESKAAIAALGGENIACGTYIDKDGKVSYWSVSKYKRNETTGKSYKEMIQDDLKAKRIKKKEEEALKKKKEAEKDAKEKLFESIKVKRMNEAVPSETHSVSGTGNSIDYQI